ncbi:MULTISPECIES: hypothetical protein [unclassified Rhizobium]|uniref:hypothetical protein n=1 Tax=unclassified Rhizobium TaxID=2613769 RepID=UPI0006459348|nr:MULTISPECIES: hypothetical protein [unclassified Rhizobium]MBN8953952.1 hypothetical protein [Rhizobium tropici]OJY72198.1 MAG: hypothetical protein BGP09_06150 [Rhizobium sp. 60-20]
MPGSMRDDTPKLRSGGLAEFENALAELPEGYAEGRFLEQAWGVTVKRSADEKRVWLYGEELGGTDIISFNLYVLSGTKIALKPCEMSSSKVVDFVLGFRLAAMPRTR